MLPFLMGGGHLKKVLFRSSRPFPMQPFLVNYPNASRMATFFFRPDALPGSTAALRSWAGGLAHTLRHATTPMAFIEEWH